MMSVTIDDKSAVSSMLRSFVVGADAWADDAVHTTVRQTAEPTAKSMAVPLSVEFADNAASVSMAAERRLGSSPSHHGACLIRLVSMQWHGNVSMQ